MITFASGFLVCLTLIVAIGAQNVFVLRQGLRRELIAPVIAICALSDAVLIAVGIGGLGRVVESTPWLVDVARWGGAGFLLVYAALAARRSWRPAGAALAVEDPTVASGPDGAVLTRARVAPVVGTALALTWLNPHVYLDTVFLIGSIAATHGDDRWIFGVGGVTASLVWFTGLGLGARHLGRWLQSPRSWRVLDGGIAVIMAALAVKLAAG
ncbi:LysE/ArgO family amino acid transporter [Aeromicrobium sp. CF4.19]|uniref:LysE/ArgO family amino acid transporter n=1 Tax=Aeromicrobium sp. CF4.19 TaxID=3373082 RepID=UPI003EE57311